MTQPTGVFVRLHDGALNEEQIAKLCNPKRTMTESLFAIGTPVTGGELEPLAFVNADRLKWKIATNNDTCLTFSGKPHLGSGTLDLSDGIVLHSDALAKLAEKDAEIARLRDHLEVVRSYLQEAPSVIAMPGALDAIKEALKGPAA